MLTNLMSIHPQTFIEEIAAQVYLDNPNALHKCVIVFPNRRAGLFFQKALASLIDKPVWMPMVMSMEDFVIGQSGFKKIEKLEAVLALYGAYQKHQPKEESLDQFFFWGEMILKDFEEIDQYLVNTDHLFRTIKSQKELDEEFYFLSEEDKAVIQQFWSTFLPQSTKTQEAFLEMWKLLKPVYDAFKSDLTLQGLGYGGMIYRHVAEDLSQVQLGDKQLYFCGFNALTFVEERIVKHCITEFGAKMIWDVDAYYIQDDRQESGVFLRSYSRDSSLAATFPPELPARISLPKAFEAVGVSLEIGQAKALSEELDKLAKTKNFKPHEVVVVLPQEHMLLPVLNAIPATIADVNVTMGYPLKDTPVYSLLETVLYLQQSRRDSQVHGRAFYHKPVMEVLNHPLIQGVEQEKIEKLLSDIRARNTIVLYQDDLPFQSALLTSIFRPAEDPVQYLLEIMEKLYAVWKTRGEALEPEYIARFYEHMSVLGEAFGSDKGAELNIDFLIKLFRKVGRSLKVPFSGEPLSGLQIMGVLETRNLDFKHVFIVNMNEDSWPQAPSNASFIPYNIRKAFDLPVHDHSDAIYSYLFYRLLQRAESVHFFYNTVSQFNVNGELSRLVQQLEVESGHTIKKRLLSNPIVTTPTQPITIEKDSKVMSGLDRYLDGFVGKRGTHPGMFTPSALNAYLDCRLRFYFKYVIRLYEPDLVQEEMDPMVFGNILHDSMEILYKQFTLREKTNMIHPQNLFWIRQGVEGAINQAFLKHYGIKNEKKFNLEGRSIIAMEVLKKFVNKILDYDESYAPFEVVGLEASNKDGYAVSIPIEISGNRAGVRLKGIIDRIDKKDGLVRVIDYKTGRDEKDFSGIQSLFDRTVDKRRKAVFQVFFYSYLFKENYPGSYSVIEPGIFNSKDLFSEGFHWRVTNAGLKEEVSDYYSYHDAFGTHLKNLMEEIYNLEVPFDQTDDVNKCSYCPYKGICGR